LDDDDSVQRTLSLMLKKMGYNVVNFTEGQTLINYYSQAIRNEETFYAIILDLTIPGGLGGKEVIKDLRKISPDFKGIVSSGYSNDEIIANFRDYDFDEVLQKPYSYDELKRALHYNSEWKQLVV